MTLRLRRAEELFEKSERLRIEAEAELAGLQDELNKTQAQADKMKGVLSARKSGNQSQ